LYTKIKTVAAIAGVVYSFVAKESEVPITSIEIPIPAAPIIMSFLLPSRST